MRERDPRGILARSRAARARVQIVQAPESKSAEDGSVTSKQVADVTLPRSELERIWNVEYLERLARTYWLFLSRVSLGLLRVLYTEASREIVVVRRPLRLLHLDLLVLLAFGISHVFFNRGEIGVSAPLVYPVLLYLLARVLLAGFRPRRAAGSERP